MNVLKVDVFPKIKAAFVHYEGIVLSFKTTDEAAMITKAALSSGASEVHIADGTVRTIYKADIGAQVQDEIWNLGKDAALPDELREELITTAVFELVKGGFKNA